MSNDRYKFTHSQFPEQHGTHEYNMDLPFQHKQNPQEQTQETADNPESENLTDDTSENDEEIDNFRNS